MINITAFAFTAYPVTDLPRARAFYENLLGLKPASVWGDDKQGWIEYELGDVCLAISNFSADKWKPSADGASLALEVADFPVAVAALRAAGVRFLVEAVDSSACNMAIIADPDGNSLIIHRRNAKS
jgi:catechol 2,3-dioxygenase-like lactoylglutathione lyase family enzyme